MRKLKSSLAFVIGWMLFMLLMVACMPVEKSGGLDGGVSTGGDSDNSSDDQMAGGNATSDPNGGILGPENFDGDGQIVEGVGSITIPPLEGCYDECVEADGCDAKDNNNNFVLTPSDQQECYNKCANSCEGETISGDPGSVENFVIPGYFQCKRYTVSACSTFQEVLNVGPSLRYTKNTSIKDLDVNGREYAFADLWQKQMNTPWVGRASKCPSQFKGKAIVRTNSATNSTNYDWNAPDVTGFNLTQVGGDDLGFIDPNLVAPNGRILTEVENVRVPPGAIAAIQYYDNDPIREPEDPADPAQIDTVVHFSSRKDKGCGKHVIYSWVDTGISKGYGIATYKKCAQVPEPGVWEVDFKMCYEPNPNPLPQ